MNSSNFIKTILYKGYPIFLILLLVGLMVANRNPISEIQISDAWAQVKSDSLFHQPLAGIVNDVSVTGFINNTGSRLTSHIKAETAGGKALITGGVMRLPSGETKEIVSVNLIPKSIDPVKAASIVSAAGAVFNNGIGALEQKIIDAGGDTTNFRIGTSNFIAATNIELEGLGIDPVFSSPTVPCPCDYAPAFQFARDDQCLPIRDSALPLIEPDRTVCGLETIVFPEFGKHPCLIATASSRDISGNPHCEIFRQSGAPAGGKLPGSFVNITLEELGSCLADLSREPECRE